MSDITGDLQGAPLDAVVELLYLAASADSEFSAEERDLFVHKVRALAGEQLTSEALAIIVSRIEGDVEREGRTQRIASVRERIESDGARHAALLMAIDMTMADDVLRTSEREVIADIAEGLGIAPDVAADYIARMNR
jgi:tellurite resistance protein